MPQPLSEESKDQWKKNILKQRESGLSIACWCRNNNIADHSFYYWQRKFSLTTILDRSSFTEISDQKQIGTSDLKGAGIIIEYQGMRIHLEQQFETSVLKQCIEVLKETMC